MVARLRLAHSPSDIPGILARYLVGAERTVDDPHTRDAQVLLHTLTRISSWTSLGIILGSACWQALSGVHWGATSLLLG